MSTDPSDRALRDHVVYLLKGGGAHLGFEKTLAGLPPELRGAKAPGLPHTVWKLLEHLRLAQWDILEFSRSRDHISPKWPEGYWPDTAALTDTPENAGWEASLAGFRKDLKAMEDLMDGVIGDEERFARDGLAVAPGNLREEVGGGRVCPSDVSS